MRRLIDPPEVRAELVGWVALVGVVISLLITALLARAQGESLNVRGAYLHVVTDVAAFVGTGVAAGLILLTGWDRFDPIASMLVAGLLLWGSYGLLRKSPSSRNPPDQPFPDRPRGRDATPSQIAASSPMMIQPCVAVTPSLPSVVWAFEAPSGTATRRRFRLRESRAAGAVSALSPGVGGGTVERRAPDPGSRGTRHPRRAPVPRDRRPR